MTTKHSPLPWNITETGIWGNHLDRMPRICVSSNGHAELYRQLSTDEQRANEAFIFRACNSHYELLSALEACKKKLFDVMEFHTDQLPEECEELILARTVIGKATGA